MFTAVSAVLRIASAYPQYRVRATSAILSLSSRLTQQLKSEPRESSTLYVTIHCKLTHSLANVVLIQYAPAFHGLYRAMISSPFTWSAEDWASLTMTRGSLLKPEVVDFLNDLLPQSLQRCDNQEDQLRFIHLFLSRYVAQERPLTGYFIVCCVMEISWTVLAQALSPSADQDAQTAQEEAAAANRVWNRLTNEPVENPNIVEKSQEALNDMLGYAISCFSDLQEQIEDMDNDPSIDTYAWETMAESLVRSPYITMQLKLTEPRKETGNCLLCCTTRTKRRAAEQIAKTSQRRISYHGSPGSGSRLNVDYRTCSKVSSVFEPSSKSTDHKWIKFPLHRSSHVRSSTSVCHFTSTDVRIRVRL